MKKVMKKVKTETTEEQKQFKEMRKKRKAKTRIVSGQNIRRERIARNMSPDELAEMVGISKSFINSI